MFKVLSTTVLTACLAVLSLPLHAQNGPVGIAFVQAPEQGGGVAIASTPEVAFANATAQCMQFGAREQDCIKTNWCMPAGWSVDVFVQHQEGPHWHEVVCGLPTKSAALAAVLHMCDPSERDYLVACYAVQLYNPRGKAQTP